MDYSFKNKNLLEQALNHKSLTNTKHDNYERLEFLGDSVLSLSISHQIILKYPKKDEGFLSKIRSGLINQKSLFEVGMQMGINEKLKVGKNVDKNNPRLIADAVEALLGAIYLDSDFNTIDKIIQQIFNQKLASIKLPEDYKTQLQEWCQRNSKSMPNYLTVKEEGLEHEKIFFIEVRIDNQVFGLGASKKKRESEQKAAKEALKKLSLLV